MQRGHLNGSYTMPEFCEVAYSATLAGAQGHNFKGWGRVFAVEGSECTIKWQTEKKASSHSMTYVFLTAFHSIPSSDSASVALYLESEHSATDPKVSLRSAAQQNTQTQGDPAKLFLFISSEVPRATHEAVLQCLTAIIINSLQPCISAQNFVHFLRLSQSAQSVPSSRRHSSPCPQQVPMPSSGLHYPSSSSNLKGTATACSESASGIRQSCREWCHAGRHVFPRCNEQRESLVSIACFL